MFRHYPEIKQFIQQIEDEEITDLALSAREYGSVGQLTAKFSDLEYYKSITVWNGHDV